MSPEVISMREPDEPMISERLLLSSGRYVSFGPFRIDQQRQGCHPRGAAHAALARRYAREL